jgi:hypothetical protein
MGFQLRRRTKGKNAWFNFSASRSRGIRGSASVKLDENWTLNFGRHGARTTINFGNGLRYVTTKSLKSKPKKQNSAASKSSASSKSSRAAYGEGPLYIQLADIPHACNTIGKTLLSRIEYVNEDQKIVLRAVNEALTVHVKKAIEEKDRSALSLIQECINELKKLKATSTDEDVAALYERIIEVITYIKRGFDYGVYKQHKQHKQQVEKKKDYSAFFTWLVILFIVVAVLIV